MRGEMSNDAGGLTQRWIIRACIPAGFVIFGVQVLAVLGRCYLAIVGAPHDDVEVAASEVATSEVEA